MAIFCPSCGSALSNQLSICCPYCGAQVGQQMAYSAGYSNTDTLSNVLGTLVTVSLVGGLTRQLYYYGGRYFLDPCCRSPFGMPHSILHHHRIPPIPPVMHRPMVGPRPMGRPMGPFGGPHGHRGRR